MNAARKIAFVGFDGVTALDLVGPYEVFGTANALGGNGHPLYELAIVAPRPGKIVSDTGLTFEPTTDFSCSFRFDTIVTPGGPGLRDPALNAQVAEWLLKQAPTTRRMASVCTGAYGLAATGLLNGRRVCTHWRLADDFSKRYPEVIVDADSLFVADPPIYTSAGITAGIDLSLALVEEDHGPRLALSVARELVVYLKRPGGQQQFSEALRFQSSAVNRLSELAAWLPGHLHEDLTVEALAKRANLSARQFSRTFAATFGITPGRYVEELRLETSRERLAECSTTIENVALSVGFQSADVFRRRFQERFGVPPGTYKRHFRQSREV